MKKMATLLIVLLLVATVPAFAAQEKEVHKAGACKAMSMDGETKVKLEKLKLQYKLEMVDLKAEKNKTHEEMMAELMKDEPSTKTIEILGKSMNGVQYKMHKAKIDYVLKVKKILPADHFKAFLHKQNAADAGSQKACCAKSSSCLPGKTGHKCCADCAHLSAKCPMAGTEGHKCTSACTHKGIMK